MRIWGVLVFGVGLRGMAGPGVQVFQAQVVSLLNRNEISVRSWRVGAAFFAIFWGSRGAGAQGDGRRVAGRPGWRRGRADGALGCGPVGSHGAGMGGAAAGRSRAVAWEGRGWARGVRGAEALIAAALSLRALWAGARSGSGDSPPSQVGIQVGSQWRQDFGAAGLGVAGLGVAGLRDSVLGGGLATAGEAAARAAAARAAAAAPATAAAKRLEMLSRLLRTKAAIGVAILFGMGPPARCASIARISISMISLRRSGRVLVMIGI